MAYTISKKAQDNLNIFFNEYCKNCKGLTNINDVINKAVKFIEHRFCAHYMMEINWLGSME